MNVDEGRYSLPIVIEAVLITEYRNELLKEEIRKLHEASELSPEQKEFFEPIFKAGAKKLGYKIKKLYSMSDGVTAEIEIYKLFKYTGSSGWEIADFFTKKEAMVAKKALENNMMNMKIGEKSYRPEITLKTDTYWLSPDDLHWAGIKFDNKKARELRRS